MKQARCLLGREAHEPHVWYYTSWGGGHMITEPTESEPGYPQPPIQCDGSALPEEDDKTAFKATVSDWVVMVDGEFTGMSQGFKGHPAAADFARRAQEIFPGHKYEVYRRDTKVTFHKWSG